MRSRLRALWPRRHKPALAGWCRRGVGQRRRGRLRGPWPRRRMRALAGVRVIRSNCGRNSRITFEPSHLLGDWRPSGCSRYDYLETYAITDSKSRKQIIDPRVLEEIFPDFAAVDEELTCSRGLLDGAHELGPRPGVTINVRSWMGTARIGKVARYRSRNLCRRGRSSLWRRDRRGRNNLWRRGCSNRG